MSLSEIQNDLEGSAIVKRATGDACEFNGLDDEPVIDFMKMTVAPPTCREGGANKLHPPAVREEPIGATLAPSLQAASATTSTSTQLALHIDMTSRCATPADVMSRDTRAMTSWNCV